jgi:hypothetical protein
MRLAVGQVAGRCPRSRKSASQQATHESLFEETGSKVQGSNARLERVRSVRAQSTRERVAVADEGWEVLSLEEMLGNRRRQSSVIQQRLPVMSAHELEVEAGSDVKRKRGSAKGASRAGELQQSGRDERSGERR